METRVIKKIKRFSWQSLFPPKISLAEQTLLAKHLSMMLKSGISEVESLGIIKDQNPKKSFKRVLESVTRDVEGGQFLSESLGRFKDTFGDLFINLVKLGEVSGTLPDNLNYLSEEIKKRSTLKAKVKSAMIYPMIIFFTTIAITTGLIVFVLPKILGILGNLKVELPVTTKILIAVANVVNNDYLIIIGAAIITFVTWKFLKKLPAFKYFIHQILLKLPIAGKIALEYNMSNIARTLGLLLQSGVKIVEAVDLTAKSVSNTVIKRALATGTDEIKRGGALYKALDAYPNIFPVTLTRMIQIGERTGNLDSNLIYLATFYENEVDEKLKNLSSTLEPILMIFMGVLVGFVAISIITPIYEISKGV